VYQDNPALAGYPTLIQERIVGPGMGLFVLCDHGHVVASFAHRRHREKPPSGGASVLSESVAVDQTLLEHARRLLGPLGWHGVAMLEYKRDHRSGREFLLEINGRFWGSLQLAIDAGVDFPYLACLLALGTLTDGDRPYRLGVKNRWFLGDLDHLLARLLHSGRDLPEGSGSRWRAMLTFLHGFDADTRNEIACGDDLRPALRELTDYVRTLGTSAMERLRVPPRNRGADIAMSQAPIVAKSADASK